MYDDRRVDIGRESHEDDREMLETTTHDRPEKRELCIQSQLFCKCLEESNVHARNGYDREELIDRDDTECREDLPADMFSCPDFLEIGDHVMILRIWRILGKK